MTDAFNTAASAILFALIDRLVADGVLTRDAARDVLKTAMSQIDTAKPTAPDAHAIIGTLLQRFAKD